jgi:hypothetical protein
MTLKRRSGRKEVIVPEGLDAARSARSGTTDPLLTALARAFVSQNLIDSGRYRSMALANALDLDNSYARRIPTLGCLSPETTVKGGEASGFPWMTSCKARPCCGDSSGTRWGLPPVGS